MNDFELSGNRFRFANDTLRSFTCIVSQSTWVGKRQLTQTIQHYVTYFLEFNHQSSVNLFSQAKLLLLSSVNHAKLQLAKHPSLLLLLRNRLVGHRPCPFFAAFLESPNSWQIQWAIEFPLNDVLGNHSICIWIMLAPAGLTGSYENNCSISQGPEPSHTWTGNTCCKQIEGQYPLILWFCAPKMQKKIIRAPNIWKKRCIFSAISSMQIYKLRENECCEPDTHRHIHGLIPWSQHIKYLIPITFPYKNSPRHFVSSASSAAKGQVSGQAWDMVNHLLVWLISSANFQIDNPFHPAQILENICHPKNVPKGIAHCHGDFGKLFEAQQHLCN